MDHEVKDDPTPVAPKPTEVEIEARISSVLFFFTPDPRRLHSSCCQAAGLEPIHVETPEQRRQAVKASGWGELKLEKKIPGIGAYNIYLKHQPNVGKLLGSYICDIYIYMYIYIYHL